MRTIVKVLGICCLCMMLTACNPIFTSYEFDELRDNAVHVELVHYDNPRAKEVSDFLGMAKHHDFNPDRMERIGTMEADDYELLFTDIAESSIGDYLQQYNAPKGICIRIEYDNGEFDIISQNYIGRFDSEGNFVKFMGVFASGQQYYKDLVNSYFTLHLE